MTLEENRQRYQDLQDFKKTGSEQDRRVFTPEVADCIEDTIRAKLLRMKSELLLSSKWIEDIDWILANLKFLRKEKV